MAMQAELEVKVKAAEGSIASMRKQVESLFENVKVGGGALTGGAGSSKSGDDVTEGLGGIASAIGIMTGIMTGGLSIIIELLKPFTTGIKPLVSFLETIANLIGLFALPFSIILITEFRPLIMFIALLLGIWLMLFTPMIQFYSAFSSTIIRGMEIFFRDPVAALKGLFLGLTESATGAINTISNTASKFTKDPVGTLKDIWDSIVSALQTILPFILGINPWIWNIFTSIFTAILNPLMGLGKWIWNILVVSLTNGFNILTGLGKLIFGIILPILTTEFNFLIGLGKWIWNALTALLILEFNFLVGIGKWIWNELTTFSAWGFGALSNLGQWIWNAITGLINSVLSGGGSIFGGIANSLPHFASGGITSGPSIAGENGPELITPLTGSNAGRTDTHYHFHGDIFTDSTMEAKINRILQRAFSSRRGAGYGTGH